MATLGTPIDIVAGNKRLRVIKYTGPASYATGGDALNVSRDLGVGALDVILVIEIPTAALAPAFLWNGSLTTPKIQAMYSQGGSLAAPTGGGLAAIAASTATPAVGATAVTSTAAQPAIPVTFGAITQDAAFAREVQATANLSTYSCYLLIIGA